MLWIAYRQNCSFWNERVLVISFAETKDPPDCKRTRTYSSWYRRYSPRVWTEFLLSVPRNKRLCVEQSKVYQCTKTLNVYTCNFCSIEGCTFMYLIVLVNVYHYPLGIHAFFFCTLAWLYIYIHVCDCACQKDLS